MGHRLSDVFCCITSYAYLFPPEVLNVVVSVVICACQNLFKVVSHRILLQIFIYKLLISSAVRKYHEILFF
jgi:hypothetical protein